MQNPLVNLIAVFSLVRDDRGFQVNPLCRHDITSPFPPSGIYFFYISNIQFISRYKLDLEPQIFSAVSFLQIPMQWYSNLNIRKEKENRQKALGCGT